MSTASTDPSDEPLSEAGFNQVVQQQQPAPDQQDGGGGGGGGDLANQPLTDQGFHQLVAQATNVPSKGGPDPSQLSASTGYTDMGRLRILSEWKPGEEQTGATQRNGNYYFSEGSVALSNDIAQGKIPLHDKVGFIKDGKVVRTGYYDDYSFKSQGVPNTRSVEFWGHPADGHYDGVVDLGPDDRPKEAGTLAYHNQAIRNLGAEPAAIGVGGEAGGSAGETPQEPTQTQDQSTTTSDANKQDSSQPKATTPQEDTPLKQSPPKVLEQPQAPAPQEEEEGTLPISDITRGFVTPQMQAQLETMKGRSGTKKTSSQQEEPENPILAKLLAQIREQYGGA